jgi:hypothetical protein
LAEYINARAAENPTDELDSEEGSDPPDDLENAAGELRTDSSP